MDKEVPFFINSHNDDGEFLEAMDRFIGALVETYNRPELFVIRIDNWFDHKWLNFAGKTKRIHALIGSKMFMCAPAVWKYKTDTTLPPFAPNRVISQEHFKVKDEYIEYSDAQRPLHSGYKRPSSFNLNNRLLTFAEFGLFVWLSSGTASSDRASILVYNSREDYVGSWYASFIKSEQWKLNKAKNVDRDAVGKIFSRYYEEGA